MSIKHIIKKAGLAGAAVLSALSLVVGVGTQVASAASQPTCRSITPISVTLSPTGTTTYSVAGQLCATGSLHGKTMQLLVHGFTYDHRYWDWPNSPQYSYARTAAAAGYATLAIDRLGDGTSSHPVDGNTLTAESEGYVLHQIIQKLRAGAIEGTAFNKVVTVGHSLGSVISAQEAATYHDVSGVILSGYLHDVPPAVLASFGNGIYPANQDPAFANSGLNDTYLTTRPESRAPFFFNAAHTDPSVITKDEQIKQTGTTGEAAGFDAASALTPQINVPVLLAMGQNDALFCDNSVGLSCDNRSAILAREQSHFSPAAHLQAYVLPGSGHDMNLEQGALQWYAAADLWTALYIGR